jgi:hypothetical protein
MRRALILLFVIGCTHRQPVRPPDPDREDPPVDSGTGPGPTTPTPPKPHGQPDESARQPWARTDPAFNVWRDGKWVSKKPGQVRVNPHPVWTPGGWTMDPGGWLAAKDDLRYEQGAYECHNGEHTWVPGGWYADDKPREARREPPAIFMRERPASGRLELSINQSGVLQHMIVVDGALVWRAAGATWTMRADGSGCIARVDDGLQKDTRSAFAVAGGRLHAVTRSAIVHYSAEPGGPHERVAIGPLAAEPVLAVSDGKSLYIHLFATDAVVRVPVAGGAVTAFAELPRGSGGQGVAMTVHDGALYLASYSTGDLLAFPTSGGAPRSIARGLPNPRALAVDGAAVYVLCQFAKRGGSELEGQLRRIELATGASKVLASNLFNGGHVALDGSSIYVPSRSTQFGDDVAHDGKLFRVARDGSRPPQAVVEGMEDLGPILVDDRAIYVQVLDRRSKTRVIRLDKP